MTRAYLSAVLGLAAGLVLGIALDLFPMTSGEVAAKEEHDESAATAPAIEADPLAVHLEPELAKRARLTIASVEAHELTPLLRLVGSVNFDQNRVADVGARVEGRVAQLFVTQGDLVKRGQPLIEIESSELGTAQAALLSARANLIAAEMRLRRETELAQHQLASASVLERARAEAKALRAELHGATQRLLSMGASQQDIQKIEAGKGPTRLTLRAPIAGEVIARYATMGQVVSLTTPILRLADLDHLWVELDVFERDLAHVSLGDGAEIESETHPGETVRGRVKYIDSTIDMATRAAHVRIEVENARRLLRPGQFVHARLATEGAARPALGVPRHAVVQIEGAPSVFIEAGGKDNYLVRRVELGITAGDWVEIKRGLVEADRVVTAGAFVLKSELLR